MGNQSASCFIVLHSYSMEPTHKLHKSDYSVLCNLMIFTDQPFSGYKTVTVSYWLEYRNYVLGINYLFT